MRNGSKLESEIIDHFLASFCNTKATQHEFQVQFLRTELAFCKEAFNKELMALSTDLKGLKNEKVKLAGVMKRFE